MEYVNIGGLKVKTSTGRKNLGISSYIRSNLNEIPTDGAVSMSALALALRIRFSHIDQNQSYVRVNMVLKRLSQFTRFEDADGKTFIGRKAMEVEEEPETDQKGEELSGEELSDAELAEIDAE